MAALLLYHEILEMLPGLVPAAGSGGGGGGGGGGCSLPAPAANPHLTPSASLSDPVLVPVPVTKEDIMAATPGSLRELFFTHTPILALGPPALQPALPNLCATMAPTALESKQPQVFLGKDVVDVSKDTPAMSCVLHVDDVKGDDGGGGSGSVKVKQEDVGVTGSGGMVDCARKWQYRQGKSERWVSHTAENNCKLNRAFNKHGSHCFLIVDGVRHRAVIEKMEQHVVGKPEDVFSLRFEGGGEGGASSSSDIEFVEPEIEKLPLTFRSLPQFRRCLNRIYVRI